MSEGDYEEAQIAAQATREVLVPAVRDMGQTLEKVNSSVAQGAEKIAADAEQVDGTLAQDFNETGAGLGGAPDGAGGIDPQGGGTPTEPGGGTPPPVEEPPTVGQPQEGGIDADGADGTEQDGDPVDVVSGQMLTSTVDVDLAGLLPLILSRTYASGYRYGKLFGPGWSSTLDQRVVVDADGIHFFGDDAQHLLYPVPTQPGQRVYPVAGARLPLTWDRASDTIRLDNPWFGRTWHFAARGAAADETEERPLSSVTDRNGHEIRILRDGDGLPTEVDLVGAYRVGVTTVYTPTGFRVERFTLLGAGGSPDTDLVEYRYDVRGRLQEITNSTGVPYVYEYDAADRITAWIDRIGFRYEYAYDESGRVVGGSGEGGYLAASFAYDPENRTTVVTNSLGHETTYLYDEHNRIVEVIDAAGAHTRIERDRRGRVVTFTDPLGHSSRYTRNDAGDAVRIERPDGAVTEYDYDENTGLPVRVMSPGGAQWRHAYSESGNLLTTTDPLGAVAACTVDERGHLAEAVEADGSVYRFESNAAGRPLSVTTPAGGTTHYELDAFGRVIASVDPRGAVTRYGWSVEGLQTWQQAPDGARSEFEYDPAGNVRAARQPSGTTVRFEVGPFNLVAARTDPDGSRYSFDYNTELRLVRVLGPSGATWDYEYDAVGRLIRECDFADRERRYTYDAAGRRIAVTDADGREIRVEYDVRGRAIRRWSGDDESVELEYDLEGRLSRAVCSGIELAYERDLLGRPLFEHVDGRTVSSRYDALGRRVSRTTPSGIESSWSFAADRREFSLSGVGGGLSFRFDESGREHTRFLGSGAAMTQSFDEIGRLTGQALWSFDAAGGLPSSPDEYRSIQQRDYAYRADGLVEGVGDALRGSRSYELSSAGRVTAVTGATWTERYTYDNLGNVTAGEPGHESDESGAREFDGLRLRVAGRTSYEYDALGRLQRKIRRTLSGQRKEWRYSWNWLNRLVEVDTPDAGRWRYTYDPLGRRVAKRRVGAEGSALEEVFFSWDGADLVEQQSVSHLESAPMRTVTWDYQGADRTPVAQTSRSWLADAPDAVIESAFHAIVTDLVGTPSELVTADGRIAWYQTTSLWGEQIAVSGADSADCPLRFPGQYHDAETGLHYNFYRYYDPGTARYITPDPLGLPAAPNDYAYVPNPVVQFDPFGLIQDARGRFAVDPDNPPSGHNRATEYPKDYWQSTHDYMAQHWTDEGRAQGRRPMRDVLDASGTKIGEEPIPRSELTWRDSARKKIPFGDLTYDHEPAVVQHWVDEGHNQPYSQRKAWYNKTDGMSAMSRPENSRKGQAQPERYSDAEPGPNYTCKGSED